MGINKGNLSKCISGKYRSSGGFGWRSATASDLEVSDCSALPVSASALSSINNSGLTRSSSCGGQPNRLNSGGGGHNRSSSEGCTPLDARAKVAPSAATAHRAPKRQRRVPGAFDWQAPPPW
jgi:hypothetical protein